MKKIAGYDQAESFAGDYERLAPGGYICQVLKAEVEDKDYGQLFRLYFDIYEGEHKGFYKKQFDNKKQSDQNAKWSGVLTQTIRDDNLKYFKGIITSIEASNSGYKWDWDEKKLLKKLFGGVFGEEEFITGDGEIKTSVKCRFVRSVDSIKSGNFKIPDVKKASGSSGQTSINSYIPTLEDEELPF